MCLTSILSDVQPPISKSRERGTARFFERLLSDCKWDGTVCQELYTCCEMSRNSSRICVNKVLSN